jgi:hypothetical protein
MKITEKVDWSNVIVGVILTIVGLSIGVYVAPYISIIK